MTTGCTIHGHDEWRSTASRPRGWCARCSRLRSKARRGTLSAAESLELSREHYQIDPETPETTETGQGDPLQDPQTLAQEGPGASGSRQVTKDTGEPDSEQSGGSQGFVPPGFKRRPDGSFYRDR